MGGPVGPTRGRLRAAFSRRLDALVDLGGLVLTVPGTAVALVFGKLLLAVVLGALCLGFFLRFTGRRAPGAAERPRAPGWVFALSGLLSVLEVAVLVEAADLPVRFNQPGFSLLHWLLVLAALGAAFFIQLRVLGRLARREGGPRRR